MRLSLQTRLNKKQKKFLGKHEVQRLSDDYGLRSSVRIKCEDGRVYESDDCGYGPQKQNEYDIFIRMIDSVLEKVNEDMEKQNETK